MLRALKGQLIILGGMALGLFCGWLDVPLLKDVAQTISDLFLKLLQLISLPMIFLAITSTITGMRDPQEMRRLGRRVITYTLGTTIIAASVALLLYTLFNPAQSQPFPPPSFTGTPEEMVGQPGYLSFLLGIIPSNFLKAFIDNNVIGVAFLGILLSVAILYLPEGQKKLLNQFFQGLFGAFLQITRWIVKTMPVAIWAFMVLLVHDLGQNYEHLSKLLLYLGCVVSANLVQGLIVLPIMLKVKGISPLKTAKGVMSALTLAFFSKSSNATLPLTLQTTQKNLGVSPRVANFSLPLCSIINMNGCAAFILITVLFVSSLNGVVFGGWEKLAWILLATLAAVGNAGVPMGCFFLTSAFLIGMNVPLTMMGLILPFYTILDMIETTLNVWSDVCIAATVNKDLKNEEIELEATPAIETSSQS